MNRFTGLPILLAAILLANAGCQSKPVHRLGVSLQDLKVCDRKLLGVVEVRNGYEVNLRKDEPVWVQALGSQHPMTSEVITEKQYYLVTLDLETNAPRAAAFEVQPLFQQQSNLPHEFHLTATRNKLVHIAGTKASSTGQTLAIFDAQQRKDVPLPLNGVLDRCYLSQSGSYVAAVDEHSAVAVYDPGKSTRIESPQLERAIRESNRIGTEPGYGLADDLQYFARFFPSPLAPYQFEIGGQSYRKSPSAVVLFDSRKTLPVVIDFGGHGDDGKIRAVSFAGSEMYVLSETVDRKNKTRQLTIWNQHQTTNWTTQVASGDLFVRYAWDCAGETIVVLPTDFISEIPYRAEPTAEIRLWEYRKQKLVTVSVSRERLLESLK